jgi:hypothetical protein
MALAESLELAFRPLVIEKGAPGVAEEPGELGPGGGPPSHE